jgi:hypothetical protein
MMIADSLTRGAWVFEMGKLALLVVMAIRDSSLLRVGGWAIARDELRRWRRRGSGSLAGPRRAAPLLD